MLPGLNVWLRCRSRRLKSKAFGAMINPFPSKKPFVFSQAADYIVAA